MLAKFWDLKCCFKKLEAMGNYAPLTELASAVLYARGYEDLPSARGFLDAGNRPLFDPFLLDDMDQAVDTIREAIRNGKKIFVYGDYDVDGITATYVVYDYLRSVGARCDWRVPDRVQNGYGMSQAVLDDMKAQGAQLIITVDNGITAAAEVDYATSIGLDVVITDHHECPTGEGARLPAARAVVNPMRPDGRMEFPRLAGVGVAFKLVSALSGDQEGMFARYGDLVAVGTVADVMELKGENRALVSRGLEILDQTQNKGLSALLETSGARSKRISTATINFILAPRINAAGRISKADVALELLLAENWDVARARADELCDLNFRRQAEENELLEKVEAMLQAEGFVPERDKAIVLWGDDWCGGITGIVCSRLMGAYGVPVILMTIEDGVVKGSGRSLEGFNLYEALASMSDLLERYGGHALAAGLTMKPENLPAFKERFLAYAEKVFEEVDVRPVLAIDAEVRARSLSVENIEGLLALEPYGFTWPVPVFAMFGVRILEVTPVCMRKHLRLTVEKCGVSLTAMLFRVTPEEFDLKAMDVCDIAFTLDVNVFRGEKQISLVLQDIRASESVGKNGVALFNRFAAGEALCRCEITSLRPQREDFVAVWHYLLKHMSGKPFRTGFGEMGLALRRFEKRDITAGKLLTVLSVFAETGLLQFEVTPDYRIVVQSLDRERKTKVKLEESPLMKKLDRE